jgi:hypothetical protein
MRLTLLGGGPRKTHAFRIKKTSFGSRIDGWALACFSSATPVPFDAKPGVIHMGTCDFLGEDPAGRIGGEWSILNSYSCGFLVCFAKQSSQLLLVARFRYSVM